MLRTLPVNILALDCIADRAGADPFVDDALDQADIGGQLQRPEAGGFANGAGTFVHQGAFLLQGGTELGQTRLWTAVASGHTGPNPSRS